MTRHNGKIVFGNDTNIEYIYRTNGCAAFFGKRLLPETNLVNLYKENVLRLYKIDD